jgi:hypothetical protein
MRPGPRKLPLAVGTLLTLTACATMGPPRPPSLDLPKPPSDLRATRKGDKVVLTWTVPTVTTDRRAAPSLGPTRICRGTGLKLEECGNPVGEAQPQAKAVPAGQKSTSSYTDVLPVQMEGENPAASLAYAIEVLNADGRTAGLSNQVRVPSIRALAPPQNFKAEVTSRGVVLSWTGESTPEPVAGMQFVYRVYRRLEGSQQQILAGEAPMGNEPSFTLTDGNIEWEKTYEYHAESVIVFPATAIPANAQTPTQVESDDSPEIKVFADDVFPPAVPSELQAVFSGPGQQAFIDLIWAPDTDADLAGYNVYRREAETAPVKLNAQPVTTPTYRDADVTSGKNYFYSVSAVDLRGNESARSAEASERVP